MPAMAIMRIGKQVPVALCVALGALMGSMPASAGSPSIALQRQVEVDAPNVVVADVLALEPGTPFSNHRLAALALWAAPSPCHSVTVSSAEVSQRLRELRIDVELPVAAQNPVVFHRVCHRVEAREFQLVAQQALAAWLTGRADHFIMEPVDTPTAAAELPGRTATLVARPLEAGRALASRMQVWVDALQGGRIVRSMPVSFSVQAYGQAWVAGRDAHVDQPIHGAGLERREVDLAKVHGHAIAGDVADVRLRRPLLAGDVLTVAHLGSDGVRSGAQVTARSRVGAIDIEASAQALQDGRAGQTVWVRVAGATAAVRARVVDKAIVEVDHE